MCNSLRNGFLLRRSVHLCASDYLLLTLFNIRHGYCRLTTQAMYFDVLLTVHLSIILVIDQLNAHILVL
jgi:hypothetical protein